MSNDFKPLQGMSDITGIEVLKWQQIEKQARTVFDTFGYFEVLLGTVRYFDILFGTFRYFRVL